MFASAPILRSHGVECRPLTTSNIDAIAPELFSRTPANVFQYFLSWPVGLPDRYDLPSFRDWLVSLATNPKSRPFTIHLATPMATGEVVGSSSYLDIDPPNRALEIGCTWYTPSARGTHVNPAAKLMLLEAAFDPVLAGTHVERVTLKCDSRNAHSQRAIEKLGARREGVLRKHRIQANGYVRDTVMYGITREDWPQVRQSLLHRLDRAPEVAHDR
jgi:RimJ/RimL family protein N-acetyltransferase